MNRVRMEIPNGNSHFLVDRELEAHAKLFQGLHTKLQEDLIHQENINVIMFGYDDMLDGNTILIVTNRGTCFRANLCFNNDMSNAREVLAKVTSEWNRLPAEESDKEQYEGIWAETGKRIRFNRVFSNYRFSDAECKRLLEGETITITGYRNSDDSPVDYRGKLAEQEYRGFRYFGFQIQRDKAEVPKSILGVNLSQREMTDLASGDMVYVRNMISKKTGRQFSAYVSWNAEKGLKFHFDYNKSLSQQ